MVRVPTLRNILRVEKVLREAKEHLTKEEIRSLTYKDAAFHTEPDTRLLEDKRKDSTNTEWNKLGFRGWTTGEKNNQ